MNRLADESSPYLRQHADNPVEWWPWCDEAFAEARHRDVPVLLSVGYAACHWCHVMAHESFENESTAAVMNDLFVNIKVDREERPDVDAVYMEAVQALTGRGGWPMTVFLTHDAQPFFGGTYFPPKGRPGLPGFVDVCLAVSTAWNERRDGITEQAGKLTASLNRIGELEPEGDELPGLAELAAAAAGLSERFDRKWGGFGNAPKFPQPDLLETLLRAHRRRPDPDVMTMVTTTLDAMAAGGMYDHLGGGFARYSVDDRWLVPHFEKMLSDQALLSRAYLHGWQVTGRPEYLQVLTEIIDYVRRDLRDPGGGFYSSEDADSEGVEGRFYVWSEEEITGLLGETAPAAIEWWSVTEAGNFEGANILFRPLGADLVRPAPIESARAALFTAREGRVRPGLDDKVLTEWNGHMIAALAEAGAATATPAWIDDAETAGDFLLESLRRADGRWLRAWHSGQAGRHLACAADYAAVIDAFTCLAEATGRRRWVTEARAAADAMLDLFWDDAAGGLFTTGHDAERLVTRAKDVTDGALPSANGNAAYALMRLGALVGDDRYRQRAEAIMALLGGLVRRHPTAFSRLLAAVDMSAGPMTEVAVVGDRSDLVAAVQARYLPNAVLAWGEPYESPLFEAREAGKAYVCEGYACKAPVTEVDGLLAQLTD